MMTLYTNSKQFSPTLNRFELVYKVIIIICDKRIVYNLNVMQQSACLAINPITVDNFVELFICTPVDRASDSDLKLFILVGLDRNSVVCCLINRGSTIDLLLLQISSGPGISNRHATQWVCGVLVFTSS